MIGNIAGIVNCESFIQLQDLASHLVRFGGIAIYSRVSTETQRNSLYIQEDELVLKACSCAGYFSGFVLDCARIDPSHFFREVHTGTEFNRPEFQRCIELAKRSNLIVCSHSIDRLVRHPDFCPHFDRTPRPTPEQIQKLVSFGVTFALEIPFSATAQEIRSAETRRGMKQGKPAGTPVSITADQIQAVLSYRALWQHGAVSVRAIKKLTGVSKTEVHRILSRNCPRKV